ncbi:hypothetical protein PS662_04305 [Pseudomonas fluorescens]|uniref:Nucleotide-diphospho-sugar transferase domain-containing protein n=1 Tax=Pseudomonas fluorescens TaxID=294 RepID=A0A5E6VS99_PSEFL|nr:hypothetical protein [Pseudomonas fluorescens]VVN19851.1 hypothetical protein PS662_04305 [Pseudomonas fluorescens]
MSCTDSLEAPVKKTRHQLLYLIYGNQDVYRREAKFSILTALSHAKDGKLPSIRILTDRPEDYAGWPVETVRLQPQTLTLWQGENGYHHRRKACAMAEGLKLAEKTLFVDTDTLFTRDPNQIFKHIKPGHYLMDRLEYHWRDVCERPEYRKLGDCLRAHGVTADNGFKLYNSGLCGVTDSDAPLLQASIRLIDEWTRDSYDVHTIEQIALSFAMRDKPVREARKFVYHYFAEKRFFHGMQAFFFSQHGEQFSPELVEWCRDVPRVKPYPSAWQRLKIKWKLRNKKGALKKVSRDLLYGSAAPDHPYYTACRHEWWESASREILRWDHDRQKALLGAHQKSWPKQLPKPQKQEDEQIIMAYLKKRMAEAR